MERAHGYHGVLQMMVSRGETFLLELFRRKKNSDYEYEDAPSAWFKGRPAKALEKDTYAIQRGVMNGKDDMYVFATNLPTDVSVGDRIRFLGKMWSVSSVGIYIEEARYVNAGIMDANKLLEACPKGLTLK